MKSILVDAIREASGDKPESALSDSGSFDASTEEFGETANDEHVVDDGELELMETSSSLELPPEPQGDLVAEDYVEETASEIDANHAITIVGELPRPVPPQKAPAISRFAPLATVLAAVVVAALWMLANHLSVVSPVAGIDAQGRSVRPTSTPDEAEVSAQVAPNFPFIEIEQRPFDERVAP